MPVAMIIAASNVTQFEAQLIPVTVIETKNE